VAGRGLGRSLTASVVVATHRRTDRLALCLDALRRQTHTPDEVIVVFHVADRQSAAFLRDRARTWPELGFVEVARPGTVAALNLGLAIASGSILAFVDDDAVPDPDWLERIIAAFAVDARVAGVGGRDTVVFGGRPVDDRPSLTLKSTQDGPEVGVIRWFGRMISDHHLGVGPPRDVDVLKGANMSFRRDAVLAHGFDERLRGEGAIVHSELSICLPLRRRGWRIVYDPAIHVMHFPAPRRYGDQRGDISRPAVFAVAHNEALQILDYFRPPQRLVFALWGILVGTTESPGFAVAIRDLIACRPAAWPRLVAAQHGRLAGWATWRSTPRVSVAQTPPAGERQERSAGLQVAR
jgi:GT2 family glycosyltransferase